MTTVKQFKELGVEFVAGDERSSSVKGHGDVHMSEDMAYGSNHEPKTDHESIISFEWRPLGTLPDNPKFKLELNGNNGSIVEYTGEQDLSLTYDSSSNGAYFAWLSWRPLLDQSQKETKEEKEAFDKMKPYEFDVHVSSEKSVFTQAMADAGITLLAGMMFSSECGDYEAILVNKRSVCFEDENGWLVTMPIGKVKPIRTPKQKAVDEAIDKMLAGRLAPCNYNAMKSVIEMAYDAEVLKC